MSNIITMADLNSHLITSILIIGMALHAHGGAVKIATADSLFASGRFNEAEAIYRKLVKGDQDDPQAILRLGEIALFNNRFTEAEVWLSKAIDSQSADTRPKVLLAEVYYRQDKFQKAASLLRSIGRKVVAEKLMSFKDTRPYQIDTKEDYTSVRFIMTDPLPVVEVRVNGSKNVNFLIDTGASELVIDTEFAKEIGVVEFGQQIGTFAGGKKAQFRNGRIDSIVLGDFAIKNVPVHIMNVRRFSKPIFGGTRIDGIVGTVLLYHLISTLDYPEGRMILRLKTKKNLKELEKESIDRIVVPFWMAGDHFMVAWGKVNKSGPLLFFVDTGLAGGGFTCPQATVEEAGIKLNKDLAGEGIGGGGKVEVIPFLVDSLALGDVKEYNVHGLNTSAPFPLEYSFGFRIGGLISHGFFKNYSLTFDFKGMRLLLERSFPLPTVDN